MPEIKAIIFDWGNVLEEHRNRRFAKAFAKKYHLDWRKYFDFWKKKDDELNVGKTTFREFIALTNRKFSLSITEKEYDSIYLRYKKWNKPVLDIARRLKRKYKIAVLSDYHKRAYLQKRKILKKISPMIIISSVYKTRKPGKKIYQICLRKLRVRAEETLFIDDKFRNVRAARRAGMNAIHFTSVSKLRRALKKYGISL